jgi:glycosyltransferase involved in cell wall biosynthesis
MSIKLSIVVPIYNSEKYLNECLKSICSQVRKEVEVILVDDASKDSSGFICKKYSKKFNFVKLISLKDNKGVAHCRNLGIKNSTGAYLCFVDSDDKLLNGSIQNLLKNINKFKINDLFVLRYIILNNKKGFKKEIIKNQIYKSSSNTSSIINSIKDLNKFSLTCWNFVVRKELLSSNKIFFKNHIRLNEDTIFAAEILCMSKSFKIISEPVYGYRIFDQNTLGKSKGFVFVISRIKVICELCKFIFIKKKILNSIKLNFLFFVLKRLMDEVFIGIILFKSNEIQKSANYFEKYKYVIKFTSNLGFKKINFLLKKNNSLKENLITFCNIKKKRLKKATSQFKKEKLIIFCAGYYGRTAFKYFTDNDFNVSIVIDNNINYSGQMLDKISIKSPLHLKNNLNKFKNHKILVCNKEINAFKKISFQLSKIGFSKKNISYFNQL